MSTFNTFLIFKVAALSSPPLDNYQVFTNDIAGRKVAVDASMSLYQFLIAVRSDGAQLTGIDGEITRYIDLVI